jgi:hypothetical protein
MVHVRLWPAVPGVVSRLPPSRLTGDEIREYLSQSIWIPAHVRTMHVRMASSTVPNGRLHQRWVVMEKITLTDRVMARMTRELRIRCICDGSRIQAEVQLQVAQLSTTRSRSAFIDRLHTH